MSIPFRTSNWILLTALSAPAAAEASEGTPEAPLEAAAGEIDTIVVYGNRPALASARELKRRETNIVDAIVASEMGKLPDLTVGESLARVTGVQIARDRGETSAVALRGLTQLETTLNGREIFTAGSGRNFDFADLPAELVSAVQVYKSSSADQIEGGIGGSVDLRTRRPFDYDGAENVASAGLLYGDLADAGRGQFSLLTSRRGRAGAGEVGALLSLAHQDRPWREDQKATGAPVARTDLLPGQTVFVPNGGSETVSTGRRERNAADLVLQWRPSAATELYAEGSYAELGTYQRSYQISLYPSSSFQPGSVALFPGTSDVAAVTWNNAPVSILSFNRDTQDRTAQGALGGRWSGDALTVRFDASYTQSSNRLLFSGPTLSGRVAAFSQNLAGALPATAVSGTDLNDPASLAFTGIAYRYRPFDGSLAALRLDAEYAPPAGPVDILAAGVRLARRRAGDAPGLIVADAAVSGVPAGAAPGMAGPNPYPNFFPGGGAPGIGSFLAGNLGVDWTSPAIRQLFGIGAPIPTAGGALGIWHVDEATDAAYLMAEVDRHGLQGNVGLRAVATRESLDGSRSLPETGGIAPVRIDHTYTDYLPSLNLRYQLADRLYLRGAASKSLTRPDFDQLSPSLTLVPYTDPALNQGSAGNPALEPVRSDNLDLALEEYFAGNGSVTLTGFWKKVDGFIGRMSAPELHDGQLYQVSRPYNSRRADLNGVELGYQQFYTALPGWLGGLGAAASYTYVDSSTPDTLLGTRTPLQNLSRNSANLVGMYERGDLSARLAWNWRDRYLSGVTSVVGVGALPVYTNGYGWLDASVSWRIEPDVTLTLAGTNLLNTVRSADYGTPTRPQSSWMNDTQLMATLAVRF